MQPCGADAGFRIVESHDAGSADVPVSVDTTVCDDCLAEVDDPGDRRHGYAVHQLHELRTRYTIVLSVPYDRPATTMAGFAMCAQCQAEYDDPADRRFHAQPNACPVCGPQLTWRAPRLDASSAAAPRSTQRSPRSRAGQIVAMKGIGGYHLVADATNEPASPSCGGARHATTSRSR